MPANVLGRRAWGLALAVVVGVVNPPDVAADPAPELKLLLARDGVELWFAFDRPNKGCTYGVIKNRTQDVVEVSWGYEATSDRGAHKTAMRAPDSPWPVAAGQSVGGWAAILWCPFNKNFGAPRTEGLASLRLINVDVRNLGAERRAKADQDRLEDERRRAEKEQREREREREEAEEREREEAAEKKRLADAAEKKRLADEEDKRLADKKRRDDEEKARQAEAKKTAARNAGNGRGAVDPAAQAELERQRRIAQGFHDLRAAQETNRKMGESTAAVAGAIFAIEGGNEGTEQTTRALQLGFGFGGKFLPHMSNLSGGNVVEKSTVTWGGGFGFDGRLEVWPIYRKRFGIGIAGEGGLAGMALPAGAMYALDAGVGVKGYYGSRSRWTVLGELDLAARLVGSSANLFGAINAGSGSYSMWRLGLGPAFCKTANAAGFCETSFYALLLVDWTSISEDTGGRTGKLVRFGAMSKYMPFGAEIDIGFGYPAPGDTKYPVDPDDADRAGIYFGLALRKAWTWHSGAAKN